MLAPTNSWSYARLAEVFRGLALNMPKVSLMTYSLPLIIQFLANGPTISIFPYSVMRLHAARGSLKILPVDLPVRPWPVAILTLKDRTLSPVAERFIECARDAVKLLLGADPSGTRSGTVTPASPTTEATSDVQRPCMRMHAICGNPVAGTARSDTLIAVAW